MINFRNVLISITAILLVANFASAKKKAPKEVKVEAEKKTAAPAEVKAAPVTPAAPAAPAAPVAPAPVIEVNKPAAKAVDPKALVVTVNGTKITEGDISKILDARMEQLASRIPPNMKDQYRTQMRKRLVEQMVIEEILNGKEKAQNITLSAADVNEKVQEQMKQQNLSLDEFKALLKNYGTNYAEFESNMKKKMMFEKLMEGEFKNKIKEPNDKEIKAFYDENADQFKQPEMIHAKHILIKAADSNDPNKAKAVAKAKAEDVLKEVKAGGNFEELAKKYSACPSAQNGGDLGEAPKGSFVPAFEKAAYALEPNQVSDVVETEFGFHIIKLVAHKQPETTSLADAKEKIVQHLSNKQKEEVVVNYITKIKKEADIKFVNPEDNFEIPAPAPAAPARPGADKNEPNAKK
jgi:peptidyl-prolyl cis-trans isomerase C